MKKLAIIITIIFSFMAIRGPILGASSAAEIKGPDLIQKEKNSVLTLSDIINLYTSELGGVSVEEDDYTGFGASIGTYKIKLSASSGIEHAFKEIDIQVLDTIGYGVRAVTDKVNIHISKANELLTVDIVQVHAKTGVLTLNSTSQFEILSNDYSENHDQPGSYLFEYRIMDATGLDKTVSCYITVYDSERLESPIIIIPAAPGPFEWIKKTLNTLFTIAVIGGIAYLGIKLFQKGRKTK